MTSIATAQKQDRILFSCGSSDYSVRDVIDAAHFRGEAEPLWGDFLRCCAAEQRAAETAAEVEGSAVDEAAIAFRYQYDLITAEETEAWLEARGLNLEDFSDYFARQYWGKTLGSKLPPLRPALANASLEERELFAVELILSGQLDRMAMGLAWRVAARRAEKEPLPDGAIEDVRRAFLQRHELNAQAFHDWLEALGRDQAWLNEMLELEAAFRAITATLLTREAIQREVSSLRLPLTRLELETLELESADAAKEALMCVRDDGMSMEEVAREGRYPYARREMVLEEVPAEQQQKFLGLSAGGVLDPVARDDGFVLSRLIAKHEPSVDDPQVRTRIEQRILQRHFADLTAARVRWALLPSLSE